MTYGALSRLGDAESQTIPGALTCWLVCSFIFTSSFLNRVQLKLSSVVSTVVVDWAVGDNKFRTFAALCPCVSWPLTIFRRLEKLVSSESKREVGAS